MLTVNPKENMLELLLKEMFAQILNGIEQQINNKNLTPTVLSTLNKNQNELLRCFAELGKYFNSLEFILQVYFILLFLAIKYSDRMLPFLFQKFEQNNEKNRISSLTILKHLINSSEEQMLNKKQIIISSLRLLLTDPNNRVL